MNQRLNFSERKCLSLYERYSTPAFSHQPQEPPSIQHQVTGKIQNNQIELTPESKRKKINQIQTIIVDHYYPYTFVNKNGQPDGFSVDLMQAVEQVMGLEIQINVDVWKKALDGLKTGGIDFPIAFI